MQKLYVSYICSEKMLEMAFLGLYISKFSGQACLQTPLGTSSYLWLCCLVPRLLISYAWQVEILVTALKMFT